VTLSAPHPEATVALAPFVLGDIQVSHDGRRLRGRVRSDDGLATTVVRALDGARVTVDDVIVHRASLDDVFFALTGQARSGADETAGDPTTGDDLP
jgi:ABC-2 type transport system ATP-binding protein